MVDSRDLSWFTFVLGSLNWSGSLYVSLSLFYNLFDCSEITCGSSDLGRFNNSRHLSCTCDMSATSIPGAFHILLHNPHNYPQVGTVISVSILYMEKLRHRALKKLAPGFTVTER